MHCLINISFKKTQNKSAIRWKRLSALYNKATVREQQPTTTTNERNLIIDLTFICSLSSPFMCIENVDLNAHQLSMIINHYIVCTLENDKWYVEISFY